ncbi:unnamed protein product [Effrenium voratum]|uniref:Pseudouridine synthase RsuA/RluA-like domain-containing protein n=1 Tax=Effrenium voratum TaxID=2562239 RepID=A0AA36NCU1_9DINO|nr:unnamed protein product [Effrenium voratum]
MPDGSQTGAEGAPAQRGPWAALGARVREGPALPSGDGELGLPRRRASASEAGGKRTVHAHASNHRVAKVGRAQLVATSKAITACEKGSTWPAALQLLHAAAREKLQLDTIIMNSAISACEKGGAWQQALLLLTSFPKRQLLRDVISFNAAISACEKGDHWRLALHLLGETWRTKLRASIITFNAAISACGKGLQWQTAIALMQEAKEGQLEASIVSFSACIAACEAGQQWVAALDLLTALQDEHLSSNEVPWNSAISACSISGNWPLSLELLGAMQRKAVTPDVYSYTAVISGYGHGELWDAQWQQAMHLFAELCARHQPNIVSYGAAVSACEKGAQWQIALALLQELAAGSLRPNLLVCNAAISACEKGNQWRHAVQLLALMQTTGIQADMITYCAALSACGSQWLQALRLFEGLRRSRGDANAVSFSEALDACERGLQLETAACLLGDLQLGAIAKVGGRKAFLASALSREACNQAISACAKSGNWRQALQLLDCVAKPEASEISVNTAVSACSRGGRWQWALHLAKSGDPGFADQKYPGLDEVELQHHCREFPDQCLRVRQGLALHLLGAFQNRNLRMDSISFNSAISACDGGWRNALAVFAALPLHLCPPDVVSYTAASAAMRWQGALHMARLLRSNVRPNEVSLSGLARKLAQECEWQKALTSIGCDALQEPLTARITSWTAGSHWRKALSVAPASAHAVSAALSAGAEWPRALQMLQGAVTRHLELSVVLGAAAAALARAGAWRSCCGLAASKLQLNLVVCNAVLSSCAGVGRWRQALQVLKDMEASTMTADVLSYGAAMHGCVQGRAWQKALALLHQLPGRALQPSAVIFGTAISACEAAGNWQLALCFLEEQVRQRLGSTNVSFNAAISACEKGLAWAQGLEILGNLPQQRLSADFVSLSASVRMCARSACWELALSLLQRMREEQMPTAQASLDAGRMASLSPSRAVQVLAPETAVERLWCLAQVHCSDPRLIQEALAAAAGELFGRPVEEILLTCSSLCALGVRGPLPRLDRMLRTCLPDASLQQLLATCPLIGQRARSLLTLEAATTAAWDSPDLILLIQAKQWYFDQFVEKKAADCLLGVVFAAKVLGCVSRRLLGLLRAKLREGGRRMDQRTSLHAAGFAFDSPLVALDFPDRAVLMKPPGWDVYDEACVESRQLCTLARQVFGSRAIFEAAAQRRGFLHRLDVPSSGLVAARWIRRSVLAKTFEAYYDLQAQLSAEMPRLYAVLAHGWLRGPRSLQASVFWVGNGPTISGAQGKPSRSDVTRATRLWHEAAGAFSLLRLRITTGRRHQIRSHLSFAGHAVVTDGLYASTPVYIKDLALCRRSWLHRHGLRIQASTGEFHEVLSPVPPDLLAAVRRMSAIGTSPLDVDKWLQQET